MNLMNINSIAEAITLRLKNEKIQNTVHNIVVNIDVNEDILHKLDEECFKKTQQKKPFQQGDVLNIKIGDINFKICKNKKEENY